MKTVYYAYDGPVSALDKSDREYTANTIIVISEQDAICLARKLVRQNTNEPLLDSDLLDYFKVVFWAYEVFPIKLVETTNKGGEK